MTELDRSDPLKFRLYQLHKSFGILVLLLALVRLVWRWTHTPPPLSKTMTHFEKRAAHGMHVFLYAVMIILPLLGWLGVSASPLRMPTRIFGLFTLPHLPIYSDSASFDSSAGTIASTLFDMHAFVAYVAIALIILHIAAALKHHFIGKDDTLLRMLPKSFHKSFDKFRGKHDA